VGRDVTANADNAIALGNGASATVSNAVALGAGSIADQANTVSVGNGTTNNKIVNMAPGVANTDAVNVGQLTPALTALGATIDANGNVTGPTYNLTNGGTSTTIGAALAGLDGAVSNNTTNIQSLSDLVNSGSVGLVQQATPGANLTVGVGTDGTVVDFTNNANQARTLTGVADGQLTDTSTDAVNGSQLNATNTQVAQNTTDIGTLNTNVGNLSTSVMNLDGRVTTNETNINQLQSDISNGAVGLVKQDAAGLVTVAGSSGGNLVDFTGTDGLRRITGVENGVSDDDVVTMSQLKAAGLYDPSGDPMTVISYDDHSLASATLGGSNGTVLNNVAAGGIFAGSMQAVNGGQLFDMQEAFNSQFASLSNQYSNLDGRVGTIEQGIADGSIGGGGGGGAPGYGPNPGSGDNSVVIGDGANASGSDSTAVGNGANASGDSSTAIGNGSVASGSNSTATGANAQATGTNSTANGANAVASGSGSTAVGESASATGSNSTALGSNSSATGNNSVALGAGSVADRDNTVSVGAPGQERQITNVAAGTQRTDAANWGQVQDAVNGVRDWADQKFHQVDKRINRMGAMSAAYGQMAFSAQGLETKNRLGVGVGTQGGQSAIALGYSRQLQPNMNLSFGGSASSGDVSVGAGMSFGW